jgi:hypothetical protein
MSFKYLCVASLIHLKSEISLNHVAYKYRVTAISLPATGLSRRLTKGRPGFPLFLIRYPVIQRIFFRHNYYYLKKLIHMRHGERCNTAKTIGSSFDLSGNGSNEYRRASCKNHGVIY